MTLDKPLLCVQLWQGVPWTGPHSFSASFTPADPLSHRRATLPDGRRPSGRPPALSTFPAEGAAGRSGKPAFTEESCASALLLKNVVLQVDSGSEGGAGEGEVEEGRVRKYYFSKCS